MSDTVGIPLTKGKVTIVDAVDYELVSQHRWWADPARHTWYATTRIRGKNVRMHRLLLPDTVMVDHADGDGLNNTRANLRPATPTQNEHNSAPKSRNKSGYKGVSWHKGARKWQASIRYDGKNHGLGLFLDPEDAARAYDAAALEHFGEFAHLNFPSGIQRGVRRHNPKGSVQIALPTIPVQSAVADDPSP